MLHFALHTEQNEIEKIVAFELVEIHIEFEKVEVEIEVDVGTVVQFVAVAVEQHIEFHSLFVAVAVVEIAVET